MDIQSLRPVFAFFSTAADLTRLRRLSIEQIQHQAIVLKSILNGFNEKCNDINSCPPGSTSSAKCVVILFSADYRDRRNLPKHSTESAMYAAIKMEKGICRPRRQVPGNASRCLSSLESKKVPDKRRRKASNGSWPRVARQQQFEDLSNSSVCWLQMIKTYWFQDLFNPLVLRRQKEYSLSPRQPRSQLRTLTLSLHRCRRCRQSCPTLLATTLLKTR